MINHMLQVMVKIQDLVGKTPSTVMALSQYAENGGCYYWFHSTGGASQQRRLTSDLSVSEWKGGLALWQPP